MSERAEGDEGWRGRDGAVARHCEVCGREDVALHESRPFLRLDPSPIATCADQTSCFEAWKAREYGPLQESPAAVSSAATGPADPREASRE